MTGTTFKTPKWWRERQWMTQNDNTKISVLKYIYKKAEYEKALNRARKIHPNSEEKGIIRIVTVSKKKHMSSFNLGIL